MASSISWSVGGQSLEPGQNVRPDLWLIAQLHADDRLNRRDLVLQTMSQLPHGKLTEIFLVLEPLRQAAEIVGRVDDQQGKEGKRDQRHHVMMALQRKAMDRCHQAPPGNQDAGDRNHRTRGDPRDERRQRHSGVVSAEQRGLRVDPEKAHFEQGCAESAGESESIGLNRARRDMPTQIGKGSVDNCGQASQAGLTHHLRSRRVLIEPYHSGPGPGGKVAPRLECKHSS